MTVRTAMIDGRSSALAASIAASIASMSLPSVHALDVPAVGGEPPEDVLA